MRISLLYNITSSCASTSSSTSTNIWLIISAGKRYPIRALMMSHMFVEVDEEVDAQDEVILYNNEF
jgi:alanine racemase